MPKISVLLPVRNGEATVTRALESCLSQTLRDFEVLAVDDHSTDNTRALIERAAWADLRVRLLEAPAPGGLVPALRAACSAARGEYLARMDADDVAHPERFARQAALLDARPDISLCGCGVRILTEDGPPQQGFAAYAAWSNALTEPEAIARERFIESPVVHPSVMMRRSAAENAGGYLDPPWAEDYDLWLRMLERGMRFAKVPELLLDWRDAPGRLTRASERYSLERFLEAKAHYLARLPEVRRRGLLIAGAGPTGKTFAKFFARENGRLHGFLEVHPRRIGETIAGVPVLSQEELGPARADSPVGLSAVGQPGKRDEVRAFFSSKGYREGDDFFCIA